MREYIVSIEDNETNTAEIFVGQIRQHEEVIRCGECCYFKKLHIDRGLCLQTEGCVRLRDFCSYAERKEE